jgi:hypothetical protein
MTAQEITAHDLVGFDDLRLLASASSPCITIVLPLPNPLEIPVRLKNAIRSVTRKLEVIKAQSSDTLLEPVRELARTTETQGVWSNGLIVFRSPDIFRYFFLHQPVPELHAVEERFQIRPLLSALAREQRFHLLGLSRRDVRLFHCTQHRIEHASIRRVMSQNFRVWLATRKPDHALENRAAAGPSVGSMKAVSFGTNTDREREDEYLAHFFKEIDNGVNALLRDDTAPLLLAGTEDQIAIYHRVSTHPRLLDEYVHGSPHGLSERELHRRSMDIAMRLCSLPLQSAIAEFEKQRDKGPVSLDAQSVIKSAWEGGVADLFLSQRAEFIGRWNEQTYQVESGSPGEDLLNAAALQTVLHGGQAFGLDAEDMPEKHEVAAVLRF